MLTYDHNTIDSTGAFLVGELERLDQTLHQPLYSYTYTRDIKFRGDVSIADEFSSFTVSNYGSSRGQMASGIHWIGKNSNAIVAPQIDIAKIVYPLTTWGMTLQWTIIELEAAQRLGRPIDQQKYDSMIVSYNTEVDQVVYVGDPQIIIDPGSGAVATGLLNHSLVTNSTNATNGSWASATPAAILADVNELLNSVWAASGYAVCPDKLLVPPTIFSLLNIPLSITAANGSIAGAATSVMTYIEDNSICNSINGRPLDIQPCKWLATSADGNTILVPGSSGHTRMVAYTNDINRVRIAATPMLRTPIEYRSINQLTTYYSKVGVVEVVYPETIGYRDNI